MRQIKILYITFLTVAIFFISTDFSYSSSFSDGIKAFNSQNYVLAEKYFRNALIFEPGNYNLRYYLAITLAKNNKTEAAKREYLFIMSNSPNTEAARMSAQGLHILNSNNNVVSKPQNNVSRVELDISQHKSSLLVENAIINNSLRGNFILDTGATFTSISNSAANRLGLSTANARRVNIITANGTIKVPLVKVSSIELNGLIARDVDVIVHDITGNNGTIGLLGLSFIQKFKVTIDKTKGKLILEKS